MDQSSANPVLAFLLSRRSHPAAALRAPAPDDQTLGTLLTAAARVPDHGKLEPWRFLVIEPGARVRLAALLRARGEALAIDPAKIEKSAQSWLNAPMIVAVISTPKPSDKVPRGEPQPSKASVKPRVVSGSSKKRSLDVAMPETSSAAAVKCEVINRLV